MQQKTLYLRVGNRVRVIATGTDLQMKVHKLMLVEAGVKEDDLGIWSFLSGSPFDGLQVIAH